ncbi:MAG: GGDEF domain-containing protein, partial [bacterium]|nr:GGDEF domain-containing protein [bacterium]
WQGQRWDEIFDEITGRWQEYGSILSIQTSEVQSFAEIQAEAQECIAELSLATQLEAQQVEEERDVALKRANSDALTGLANRAAFDERLEHEVQRAVRTGRPLALAMMDVDRFKLFNDTHGHQAGDTVLQTVAKAVAGAVREVDLPARYGGEEFAVIAPECDPAGAVKLGERLRRAVEAAEVTYEDKTLKVTASFGVVVYVNPDGSRRPADLIRAADRLLYRAKDAGRNNVKCAAFRSAAKPAAKPAAAAAAAT